MIAKNILTQTCVLAVVACAALLSACATVPPASDAAAVEVPLGSASDLRPGLVLTPSADPERELLYSLPPAPVVVAVAAVAAVATGSSGRAGSSGAPAVVPVPSDVTETDTLNRTGFKDLRKVVVRLSRAEVTLTTGADYRKGLLKVDKLEGDASCKLRVSLAAGGLEVTDVPANVAKLIASKSQSGAKAKSSVPAASACKFAVTIGLREAVGATVELVKGSVAVETWSEPLKISLTWGDIDVGSVGALAVSCARCMFSGEGITGDLQYSLDSGNVGLAGLSGSVDGKTLGDTVLKWTRIRADSSVRIVSHAGDVILFFPETSPLAVDLHAPHGDVSSRFEAGSRGVPVSVTAELGNVQVYRIGRAGRPVRTAKRKK